MKQLKKYAALLLGTMILLSACGTVPQNKETTADAPESREESPAGEPEKTAATQGQETQEITELPVPGLNRENYPRVDGSTANMPLMAEVYSAVCGVGLEEAETAVDVSKTSAAWIKLAEGEKDLLLVYEPSEQIKSRLEESQVKLDSTPIGRDGLVFLVNQENRVDSLTQEQLRDIYTGKITDWASVGGDAGTIAPFQRNEESGSQTLFRKLLMQDTEPMQAPTEMRPGFMGALIDRIAAYDETGGAIGYSVYYYAKEMYANPNLKLLAVDGTEPSIETIGSGKYPLTNEFYVVIREEEPEGSPARLLRDWLLTDAGRELVSQAGYAPIQG